MVLVPASSSGPGSSGGGLVPSSSEGQGQSGGATAAVGSALGTCDPLAACGYLIAGIFSTAGIAWPTASLAILVPFSCPFAITVRQMLWFNGTVSGNVDAGIYNEDGTRVIATGSTVQAGAGGPQVASVSATALVAGSYFMALVLDNTTGQASRYNVATPIQRAIGVQQAAGAFPLPASLTLANPANAFVPLMSAIFATAT